MNIRVLFLFCAFPSWCLIVCQSLVADTPWPGCPHRHLCPALPPVPSPNSVQLFSPIPSLQSFHSVLLSVLDCISLFNHLTNVYQLSVLCQVYVRCWNEMDSVLTSSIWKGRNASTPSSSCLWFTFHIGQPPTHRLLGVGHCMKL